MSLGGVSEWPKELVLKTSVGKPTVGSNPTLSAIYSDIAQLVEQVAVNHLVPGSSPGVGAIFYFREI